jgi:sugar-specific transcriptional regulator TrmB
MKTNNSIFCEMYGNSLRNRVLEQLLENLALDFAVGDLAKETKISRPKAYQIVDDFESQGLIRKSRQVGKTQLYILNRDNPRVQLILHSFKECLRLAADRKAGSGTKVRLVSHREGEEIAQ